MRTVQSTDSEPRRLGCLGGQQSLKAPNFAFGAFSFDHGHHEYRRDDRLARAHDSWAGPVFAWLCPDERTPQFVTVSVVYGVRSSAHWVDSYRTTRRGESPAGHA